MDEHRDEKEEPLSFDKQAKIPSCPNCNFPIRRDDKKCMYCNTPLQTTGWKLHHYFIRYLQQLQWRWRLKKVNKSPRYISYFKYFAFLGIGVALTGVGGYLFFVSMLSNNFSSWVISLLFLFYGIYTLKTLFFKK